MPDKRRGANRQYATGDFGMAVLSMFFMQLPSFLAYQRHLQEMRGEDNTQTLFGMKKIPTDNHIRNMLDGVNPIHFDHVFLEIIDDLVKNKAQIVKNVLGRHTLIAIDGSEYFCSQNLSCPACSKREHSDGKVDYFHTFLGATIVKPNDSKIFCLPPEFVKPQDGHKKQDCEWRAAQRWFERLGPSCAKYNPVYLGDDLYAKHDFCSMVLQYGAEYIFTCKDTSHKTLAEFRKGLRAATHSEIKGMGSQKREHHYSWIHNLPIRDGADALLVNWFDVRIVNPYNGKKYHASFITSLTPTQENISELVSCARTRWKIENETFNVLKNNGYHFEHNFGHGKESLAAVLVTINLIAFLMHNACDAFEPSWQQARAANGPRKIFFTHLWNVTIYHVFHSWNELMHTLITHKPPPHPPPS